MGAPSCSGAVVIVICARVLGSLMVVAAVATFAVFVVFGLFGRVGSVVVVVVVVIIVILVIVILIVILLLCSGHGWLFGRLLGFGLVRVWLSWFVGL